MFNQKIGISPSHKALSVLQPHHGVDKMQTQLLPASFGNHLSSRCTLNRWTSSWTTPYL